MRRDAASTGILLMSFGAVESPDDVEAYYTNIRHGHRPTADQVVDLRARYERIGGRSPLRDIMNQQARLLEATLARRGRSVPLRVGMKFWNPLIQEGLQGLADEGVRRVVAFTSGPYDSQMSVGSYERLLREAQRQVDPTLEVEIVRQWYERPELRAAWRQRFDAALDRSGWKTDDAHVVFSAHSLPERVLATHDLYPLQFLDHGREYARDWGLTHWGYSYQSAGLTKEPWLGPDILSTLHHLKAMGVRRVLNVPIGFVADHLEILHDLDIEARRACAELDMEWMRAASLNDSPHLVDMYAEVFEERMRAVQAARP